MAYTNMQIPPCSDHINKTLHDLKSDKEYYKKLAEQYQVQLENIPEAIKKYGYIDLYDEKGNLLYTLIPKTLKKDKTK